MSELDDLLAGKLARRPGERSDVHAIKRALEEARRSPEGLAARLQRVRRQEIEDQWEREL